MPSPQWNGSPSRYEPNPIDDRKLSGEDSATYLALATAIEAITDDIPADVFRALAPATQRAIGQAEHALRRAAFGVVAYAKTEGIDHE